MNPRRVRWALIVALPLALVKPATAQQQTQAQAPPSNNPQQSQVQFRQFAEGILAATQFATDSVRGYRIEVRDLLMGPNQSAPKVPLEGVAIMELKSGAIEVTINGKTDRMEIGRFWIVSRGAQLAIRNVSEVAIIRTIVFVAR